MVNEYHIYRIEIIYYLKIFSYIFGFIFFSFLFIRFLYVSSKYLSFYTEGVCTPLQLKVYIKNFMFNFDVL